MIKLELSLFKYGSFMKNETQTFDTKKELKESVSYMVEYTKELNKESSECGEELSKWSAQFEFDGKKYNVHLDV